jgi:hypothetical protein
LTPLITQLRIFLAPIGKMETHPLPRLIHVEGHVDIAYNGSGS